MYSKPCEGHVHLLVQPLVGSREIENHLKVLDPAHSARWILTREKLEKILALYSGQYADEYLSFAFQRCHKKCTRNKRLVLIYLVPVKMLLGYMPTRSVLEKYDLMQLWEVVEAVKQGNILQLNKVMQEHELFFIKCGIYLILERLKVITYRNLFKRVYQILQTHQVPIEAMLAALNLMQIDGIDLDETHCIIANLIADGKIKGYMSHQHKKLVVSKQNAFPALSTLS